MAVPPTPEELEYIHGNSTQRSADGSFVSGPETPKSFELSDWMRIFSLLIALLGLVGNSLVLWLLGFCTQRNPFSIYILNLAGADALFLCFYFLAIMYNFFTSLFSELMLLVVLCLKYTFYIVGLSLLAAISMERCLAVLFPLWYRCLRPNHTSATVCAVLWALGSLLEVTFFLVCKYSYAFHFCDSVIILEYMSLFLLTCVLCVSSLTLLLRVQCSSQRRQPRRLYLLVLLKVLVFLLCGLPLEIGIFMAYFHIKFKPDWLRHFLAGVNSSVNPFIYFFLGRQRHRRRRETLRVILQRALGEEQELGGRAGNTPQTYSQETSS